MNNLTITMYFNADSDKLALYKSDPEDNGCEHTHEFDELVIVDRGMGCMLLMAGLCLYSRGMFFMYEEQTIIFTTSWER